MRYCPRWILSFLPRHSRSACSSGARCFSLSRLLLPQTLNDKDLYQGPSRRQQSSGSSVWWLRNLSRKLCALSRTQRRVTVMLILAVELCASKWTSIEIFTLGIEKRARGSGTMHTTADSSPSPLDTPLGIHRLFTVPSYRSLSLARHLLDASSQHTVYGCTFDPRKGDVAFSQPTDSGRRTMERWGGGNVRVFIDDERQL